MRHYSPFWILDVTPAAIPHVVYSRVGTWCDSYAGWPANARRPGARPSPRATANVVSAAAGSAAAANVTCPGTWIITNSGDGR